MTRRLCLTRTPSLSSTPTGEPSKVAQELGPGGQYGGENRPVQLRVTGQSYTYQFLSPGEAASWITASTEADTHLTAGEGIINFWSGVGQGLATPALAVFCRHHSVAPWMQKNFIMAYGMTFTFLKGSL